MKIYTRTGDDLTTSIVSKRVYKNDIVVECLGTIDELSAHLMVTTHFLKDNEIKDILIKIVKELFDVGGDVLNYRNEVFIHQEMVKNLEMIIDKYEDKLPAIKGFILPGKTQSSSYIHLSRTICRRLERRLVEYGINSELNPYLFHYINRLSDLLFVLARSMEEKND